MAKFNELVIDQWLSCLNRSQHQETWINGRDLDIGAVTAVARYGATAQLGKLELKQVGETAKSLQSGLDKGLVVYGVNTGFGGSASTRTNKIVALQRELIRMLNYGVLPQPNNAAKTRTWYVNGNQSAFSEALPLGSSDASLCLPEAWVRATMLIRLNSLVKGASGVKESTLTTLSQLLERDIIPRVPLRGSISASGDLSPLSYIAGAMMGRQASLVWSGDRLTGDRTLKPASDVLAREGITPITLGAKEGLAIVNGTAASAGVAALATYEMIHQAALSQILTAMAVEALKGTEESFHPFFAEVRQHPGQTESARNIFHFLQGSKLTQQGDHLGEGKLRQDRYSIRTASQWIGPCLEDIELAFNQVSVELNSVTDNPLINTQTGQILHGGNFQAKSITSAMEKHRLACQSLGRMLFAQCTELINPSTNFGLPPNLVIDDPSESFLWKGTDIMMAALQSELGFLSNPVGAHTQTAEMSNQALNSLALVSARYSLTAIEILSQMTSAHLVALCQALDLRAIHIQFLELLHTHMNRITIECFGQFFQKDILAQLCSDLWEAIQQSLDQNSILDARDRFETSFKGCQPFILEFMPTGLDLAGEMWQRLQSWTRELTGFAAEAFDSTVEKYCSDGDASCYLGRGSRRMYNYLRKTLKVPFVSNRMAPSERKKEEADGEWVDRPSIGEYHSMVYRSMCSGELYAEVVRAIVDVDGGKV